MKVCLLTVSDTREKKTDTSGKYLKDFFSKQERSLIAYDLVKDEKDAIQERLIYYVDHLDTDIIITSGGTGFSSRDVTPEATKEILDREVPGISEYLRMQGAQKTKRAILSRGVSGIRKTSLIINLPGSLNAVKDAVDEIAEILPHAVEMLQGKGH